MRFRSLTLIVSTLVVFAGSFSHAKNRMTSTQYACIKYYSGSQAPEKVKLRDVLWKAYEPDAIGDSHEPRFIPEGRKVELQEAAMTNQCRTSECYLFSTINYINTYNKNVRPQNAVLISEPYLVAHKFLQHIWEGTWYGANAEPVVHNLKGGFSYEGVQLTRKVGLVAKDSWTPQTPYENWDMADVYDRLNAMVGAWNGHIVSIAQNHGWESQKTRDAHQQANQELSKIITNITGPLPTEFEYNGTMYTPKSFEDMVGIPKQRGLYIDNKPGHSIPSNAKDVLNEAMSNHGGYWRFQEGDYNTIINNTVQFIKDGHPVIMDFSWKGDGHSMLVVGYNVDGQGYVTHLKVMNSWGTSYANDGYVWYTLPDVWNNVMRVYKFGSMPQ